MSERGVIYLALGTGISARLAVSLHTLRRYWRGPVSLFADVSGKEIAQQIAAAAGNVSVVDFDPAGFRAYALKPSLPKLSPYAATLQVDADTAWLGSPDALFDMLTPRLAIFTTFADWVTTGNRMRKRFATWQKSDPEKHASIIAKPWPALNTGVVGYGCESRVAREVWLTQTLQHPKEFIVDETAANLLLPWYGTDEIQLVDDRWNWSPKFGKAAIQDVKIAHFHGRKHTKDERMRAVWLPEFLKCWREDFAGIRSWCPAGDKRLAEYLVNNPRVLTVEV